MASADEGAGAGAERAEEAVAGALRAGRWRAVLASDPGRRFAWHTALALLLTVLAYLMNPYAVQDEPHGAGRTLVVTIAKPSGSDARAAVEVALHAGASRQAGLLNVAIRNSKGEDRRLDELIGGLRLHVAGDPAGRGLRCRHGVGANAQEQVGEPALVDGPSSVLDGRLVPGARGRWRSVELDEGDAWTFSCLVPDVLARERTAAGTRTLSYLGTQVRLDGYFKRTQLSRGEAEAKSAPGIAQRTILALEDEQRVVDALPQPTAQVGSTVAFHNVGRTASSCGARSDDPFCDDLVVDYGEVVADWGSNQRSAEADGVLFGLLAGLAATLWVDAVRSLVRIV